MTSLLSLARRCLVWAVLVLAGGDASAADQSDASASRALLDRGVADVRARLDVAPAVLESWGLPSQAVDHVVLHQLIAFGADEARVRHLAKAAVFDDAGLPHFPRGWGHRNAAPAVLATSGRIPLERSLESRSELHFTLHGVAERIRAGTDECRLTDACEGGAADPSWTIRFLTQVGVAPDELVARTTGGGLRFEVLIARTWRRYRASDPGLVENGLHVLDALGHFARQHPETSVRVSAREGSARLVPIGALVAKGGQAESWLLGRELLAWLPPERYVAHGEQSLDAVLHAQVQKLSDGAPEERVRAGRRLIVVLVGLGHAIESLADPEGSYRAQLDERERDRVVRAAERLARLVLRLSGERPHAAAMGVSDPALRVAWLSSLLHAARALALARDHLLAAPRNASTPAPGIGYSS